MYLLLLDYVFTVINGGFDGFLPLFFIASLVLIVASDNNLSLLEVFSSCVSVEFILADA
jgi:hypothetical protein